MVAEAVKEIEEIPALGEELAPPEPVSPPTPTEPEAEAPAAPSEDDEFVDSFAKDVGFDTEGGTDEATGDKASADGTVSTLKALSPEEAFRKGQEAAFQSLQQQGAENQRLARIQGTHAAFIGARDEMVRTMVAEGIPPETVFREQQRWDQAYGQVGTVIAAQVEAAKVTAKDEMNGDLVNFLYKASEALVGKGVSDRKQEHFKHANEGGSLTEAILTDLVENARKGMLTPAQAKQQSKDSFNDWYKKLNADAKDALKSAIGWKPSSTSTAQNATGVGTNRGSLDWSLEAPVSELIADKARRAAS